MTFWPIRVTDSRDELAASAFDTNNASAKRRLGEYRDFNAASRA
jgi:hypothetical protein